MPERTNGSATNSFSLSCLLFFFIQECRIPLRQYSTCTKFFLFIFSYAALSTTTTTTSRRFCSLSTELRVFLFLLSPSSSTPASLSTQIHTHKNYEGIREKKNTKETLHTSDFSILYMNFTEKEKVHSFAFVLDGLERRVGFREEGEERKRNVKNDFYWASFDVFFGFFPSI